MLQVNLLPLLQRIQLPVLNELLTVRYNYTSARITRQILVTTADQAVCALRPQSTVDPNLADSESMAVF